MPHTKLKRAAASKRVVHVTVKGATEARVRVPGWRFGRSSSTKEKLLIHPSSEADHPKDGLSARTTTWPLTNAIRS